MNINFKHSVNNYNLKSNKLLKPIKQPVRLEWSLNNNKASSKEEEENWPTEQTCSKDKQENTKNNTPESAISSSPKLTIQSTIQ